MEETGHYPFWIQWLVEYIAAMLVALITLFHANPFLGGALYAIAHYLANPISGGYFTITNALFIGPIRHRTWEHVAGLVSAHLAAGFTVYSVYLTRAGGAFAHGE